MMTPCSKLICAALVAVGSAVAAPTIFGAAVNAASRVPQGLPNYGIAQGATFVVSGDNLGPEQLLEAAFPLPTSVRVTVGETTVDAILVSTSAKEVSAILPSETPLGDGAVVVTYNGQQSAPAPIRVTRANFGIFTVNKSGSGPAIAKNNTPGSQQANTFTESARPGQTVVIYGTGLGAAPQDPNLAVEVLVGGRKANVLYKGRSSCCTGRDQIDFIVPASVEGCYVPVVVTVDGAISNFATIAIEPEGKPCSNPGGIPAADLERLQSAGSFRQGSISLSRSSTKIIGPTPAASANQDIDSDTAGFLQYDASQVFRYFQTQARGAQDLYGLSVGACTVFTFGFDRGADDAAVVAPPTPLDAGPVINVRGPRGSTQLYRFSNGYHGTPGYWEAGTYSFDNGGGGADVGAFNTTIKVAEPLVWTEAETIRTAERAQGLTVSWTGGDPTGIVTIVGTAFSPTSPAGASFTCSERVSAGRFTVPPIVLLSLPSAEDGIIDVNAATNVRFAAPGLDAAYITSSTLTSRSVAFW